MGFKRDSGPEPSKGSQFGRSAKTLMCDYNDQNKAPGEGNEDRSPSRQAKQERPVPRGGDWAPRRKGSRPSGGGKPCRCPAGLPESLPLRRGGDRLSAAAKAQTSGPREGRVGVGGRGHCGRQADQSG